jgi:hypothetical protein
MNKYNAQQHLAEQCDDCGIHVPNGEGHYRDDDRICEDCLLTAEEIKKNNLPSVD